MYRKFYCIYNIYIHFYAAGLVDYTSGNDVVSVFLIIMPLTTEPVPSVIAFAIINPRRACAARVTVVGSVCPLSHISPMERLFVLKTLSRTQRATKVEKFVGFSLKPLRCRDPALPPLYSHAYSRPFFSCTRMRISRVYTRMIHRRGFSTLVLFILSGAPVYFIFVIWRDPGNSGQHSSTLAVVRIMYTVIHKHS